MNKRTDDAIVIVGPGAIGLFVGAMFAKVGSNVCFLDHRPQRADLLTKSGITIEKTGEIWTVKATVSCDPAVVSGVDCIIICTKAYSTANVCRQLTGHISKNTGILSLQNGLGNIEQLERLQPESILAATTGMGALLLEPGRIQHTGSGTTWIAAPRPSDRAFADTMLHRFNAAGFDARLHHDSQAMLWTKLIINAAINPLTALYRITNGQLLTNPETALRAQQIIVEAVQVANAAGISLVESEIRSGMEEICRKTAQNSSSMRCDIEKGRKTEIKEITGAIIRHADLHGIPVPVNKQILAALA